MTRNPAAAAPYDHDAQAALASIVRPLDAARVQGAELVAFPETVIGSYLLEPMPGKHAPVFPTPISLDGPEIARLIELAGSTVVCAGFTESRGPGEQPFSTAVCVNGAGIHGVHRKVHLPPGERFAYAAGDRFGAFDTPLGRMGRSPRWPPGRSVASAPARMQDHRQTRLNLTDEPRAIENQAVWVSSNQSGTLGPLRFLANAKVVDPDGVVLATTGGATRASRWRRSRSTRPFLDARIGIDHLGDRRPAADGAGGRDGVTGLLATTSDRGTHG